MALVVRFVVAEMGALQNLSVETVGRASSWYSELRHQAPGRDTLPQLQHLKLHGYNFTWNSSLYRSLKTLELYGLSVPPPVLPFLHILRECPDLCSLNAQLSYQPGPPRMHDDAEPVELHHLRSLRLAGSMNYLNLLAEKISVPPGCTVQLLFDPTIDETSPYEHDALFMSPLSVIAPRQPVFHPLLPRASRLELELWPRANCPHARARVIAEDALLLTDLYFPLHMIPGQKTDLGLSAAWMEFFQTFPPGSTLTSLSVSAIFPFHISTEMWTIALNRFPLLLKITVDLRYYTREELSLSSMKDLIDTLHSESSICPSLHVVELLNVVRNDETERLLSSSNRLSGRSMVMERMSTRNDLRTIRFTSVVSPTTFHCTNLP
ncbi:hypothetical protein C8Q76DRAFT_739068 [Earliella scabrosa]|nr:hypothetical protein C8Q76DRAFT_739068 [Earliella scabrosa]